MRFKKSHAMAVKLLADLKQNKGHIPVRSRLPTMLSEEELYNYFINFLNTQKDAVRLDGSPNAGPNREVVLHFWSNEQRQWYGFHGGTKREAMERFVELYKRNSGKNLFSKWFTGKNVSIILSNTNKPDGWFCYPEFKRYLFAIKNIE